MCPNIFSIAMVIVEFRGKLWCVCQNFKNLINMKGDFNIECINMVGLERLGIARGWGQEFYELKGGISMETITALLVIAIVYAIGDYVSEDKGDFFHVICFRNHFYGWFLVWCSQDLI